MKVIWNDFVLGYFRRQAAEQQRLEEERQRKSEEEQLLLVEESKRQEEERFRQAVEETERQKREEEDRLEAERLEVSVGSFSFFLLKTIINWKLLEYILQSASDVFKRMVTRM